MKSWTKRLRVLGEGGKGEEGEVLAFELVLDGEGEVGGVLRWIGVPYRVYRESGRGAVFI